VGPTNTQVGILLCVGPTNTQVGILWFYLTFTFYKTESVFIQSSEFLAVVKRLELKVVCSDIWHNQCF